MIFTVTAVANCDVNVLRLKKFYIQELKKPKMS